MKKKEKDLKDFYRWEYVIDLRKNADLLITMIRFCLLCLILPLIYVLFSTMFENVLHVFKIFSYMAIALSLLCILIYYIYILIKKGKEYMMYEMTSRGIDSIKINSNNKKRVNESIKSDIKDILRGRDIIHLSHKYTSFKEIKEVYVNKKDNNILLNSPLNKNVVYAKDFDFVLEFILKNIDESVKIKYKKEKK